MTENLDTNAARDLLQMAGLFFELDEDDPPELDQMLNMNDVWAWACADGEEVPDDELPRLATLFYRYGWCGVLYWVSERNENMRSEFCDNNRHIDFVRHEEAIRKEFPNSNKRAYAKRTYTIGEVAAD